MFLISIACSAGASARRHQACAPRIRLPAINLQASHPGGLDLGRLLRRQVMRLMHGHHGRIAGIIEQLRRMGTRTDRTIRTHERQGKGKNRRDCMR